MTGFYNDLVDSVAALSLAIQVLGGSIEYCVYYNILVAQLISSRGHCWLCDGLRPIVVAGSLALAMREPQGTEGLLLQYKMDEI